MGYRVLHTCSLHCGDAASEEEHAVCNVATESKLDGKEAVHVDRVDVTVQGCKASAHSHLSQQGTSVATLGKHH